MTVKQLESKIGVAQKKVESLMLELAMRKKGIKNMKEELKEAKKKK